MHRSNLVEYESNNSDDDEQRDVTDKNVTYVKGSNQAPLLPLTTDKDVGNKSSSFFNLSSSSEDESPKYTVKHSGDTVAEANCHQPSNTTLKDNTYNTHMSFWEGTSSDDWEQPETVWTEAQSENTSTEINKSIDLVNSSCDKAMYPYAAKQTKYSQEVPQSSSYKSFNPNKHISTYTSEKLYHIHHKIAPVLHQNRFVNSTSKKMKQMLNGHIGTVNKVHWCVPQYSHLLASASMDSYINIWNAFGEQQVGLKTLHQHTKAVKDVCWSKTGKHLLSSSYDKYAIVTDIETGKQVAKCGHDAFVSVGKYHPVDYNCFVTGSKNKILSWDIRSSTSSTRSFVYKDHFGQVQDLVFDHDGRQFFTCNDQVSRDSADRNLMAWDFNKGVTLSNQIYQERYTCTRLKVHPNNSEFIAQSQGDYIAIFSTTHPYKMNKCRRFEGHKVAGYNIGCDISPDGRLVVSGSSNGKVNFYDYKTSRNIQSINLGDKTIAMDVAWHPVLNSTVAVSTWDGSIRILQ